MVFSYTRSSFARRAAFPSSRQKSRITASVDTLLGKGHRADADRYSSPIRTIRPGPICLSEIKRLHAAMPSDVLLVLDAAYAEYVQRNDYASGIELVSAERKCSDDCGRFRRSMGWRTCVWVGPTAPAAVVAMLNRIRGPFNVNGAAMAAGVAAIADDAHVAAAVAHNAHWLPWVSKAVEALGLEVVPSVGNFMLMRFPETEGCRPRRRTRI